MGLLDTILNANGGQSVRKLSDQFNLDERQTKSVLEQLVPALAGGMKRNAQSDDGLNGLLEALRRGGHERYLEQPELMQREETVNDGNNILGHLFGSKDVSRNVAQRASEKTGVESGLLKKMLPMIAAMAMGGMKKEATNSSGGGLGGLLGGLLGGSEPVRTTKKESGGLLGSFLDADGDGSIADDLFGMAKKFF
jgi:hypothetical protein